MITIMQSTNMTDLYNESKSYSDNIMNIIEKILKNSKFNYEAKTNEIIITDKNQSKSSILKLIKKKSKVSESVINILIDVVEVSDNIYIRLKTK